MRAATAGDPRILPADLDDPRVVALIVAHQSRATAETARGSAHALDAEGLRHPEIRVWSVWLDDEPVAIGALRRLSATKGELKSMYTSDRVRGRGLASRLLAHIETVARTDGLRTLFLETGSWPYFAPARAFYARHGYTPCGPFGSYREDPNSVHMMRSLSAS